MQANQIRQKFLEFFKSKGHTIIPSASLIPENDPTVLFTTAGMHPLVPYLTGEPHPEGNRLTNSQKCIRTGDIEEVGDNTHLTFFEMLGNWSLGDYFKEDAIQWSFEFLTGEQWLNIPIEKLAVTVFEGDEDAPRDEEAAGIWKRLDFPEHKITYLPKSENWWGPAGQTGPCGPDTEMFYWVGEGDAPEDSNPGNDEENWVEIWNDVFMQYDKQHDGSFKPLAQKNVDTGMGLERIAAVLQGKKSVYETQLFIPIIETIQKLPQDDGLDEQTRKHADRVIADHLRSAVFMASDGVQPGNVDQSYVMRRLIRRSIRYGHFLGIKESFTHKIAETVIEIMQEAYPKLKEQKKAILKTFQQEEERFLQTLNQGLKEFEKLLNGFKMAFEKTGRKITEISGKQAFKLYDTYGFPLEMTVEEAQKHDLTVDKAGFEEAFKKHQEKSRAGSEKKFAGGLADHSEATTRLHTATHLLHAALQKVLGDHAVQKGSNITAERLRFDFAHPQKMTPEEIEAVEKYVNDAIASNHEVTYKVVTTGAAREEGAIGLFGDKYEDKVKVYNMGPWSHEICGGPHVEKLGQLARFKIKKEQASSAGVRRIKAVLVKEDGTIQM